MENSKVYENILFEENNLLRYMLVNTISFKTERNDLTSMYTRNLLNLKDDNIQYKTLENINKDNNIHK